MIVIIMRILKTIIMFMINIFVIMFLCLINYYFEKPRGDESNFNKVFLTRDSNDLKIFSQNISLKILVLAQFLQLQFKSFDAVIFEFDKHQNSQKVEKL